MSYLSYAYNESLPVEQLAVYIPVSTLILVTNVLVIIIFIKIYRHRKFEI